MGLMTLTGIIRVAIDSLGARPTFQVVTLNFFTSDYGEALAKISSAIRMLGLPAGQLTHWMWRHLITITAASLEKLPWETQFLIIWSAQDWRVR
jgi:hypothetical protein